MNKKIKKKNGEKFKILFLNANPCTVLTGAQLYAIRAMEVIDEHFDVEIHEYAYDFMVFKSGIKVKNKIDIKTFYPSEKRNWKDGKNIISWAFRSFLNLSVVSNKKIRKIAGNYDAIINNTVILHNDKKIQLQDNYITVQHFDADFMDHDEFGIFKYVAQFLIFAVNLRNNYKCSKNLMVFTDEDEKYMKQRWGDKYKTNYFIAPHANHTLEQIEKFWEEKKAKIKLNEILDEVVYIGRIMKEQKRVHYMNEIAPLISKGFAIGGEGVYLNQILKNKSINYIGVMPWDKVAYNYTSRYISVLTSFYEGMAGSMTECLSCCTPIFMTDCSASHRFVAQNLPSAIKCVEKKMKPKNMAIELQNFIDYLEQGDNYFKACESCYEFSKKYLTKERFDNEWIRAMKHLLKVE
ncbi:MAG: glycosyltransferase [Mycoplasma sp.]